LWFHCHCKHPFRPRVLSSFCLHICSPRSGRIVTVLTTPG
jgi:hypothetical protein